MTLEREAAAPRFEELLDGMRSSLDKIEVRQDYSGEDSDPSLEAWIARDRLRAIGKIAHLKFEDFFEFRQAKRDAGVKLRRLRIVTEPYTPYTEWEMLCFTIWNIPAGEDIFIVDQQDIVDISLPAGDFSIIDNQHVVAGHYDDSGRMQALTFYDSQAGDDITYFTQLRDSLLPHATPFSMEHIKKIVNNL